MKHSQQMGVLQLDQADIIDSRKIVEQVMQEAAARPFSSNDRLLDAGRERRKRPLVRKTVPLTNSKSQKP